MQIQKTGLAPRAHATRTTILGRSLSAYRLLPNETGHRKRPLGEETAVLPHSPAQSVLERDSEHDHQAPVVPVKVDALSHLTPAMTCRIKAPSHAVATHGNTTNSATHLKVTISTCWASRVLQHLIAHSERAHEVLHHFHRYC